MKNKFKKQLRYSIDNEKNINQLGLLKKKQLFDFN